MERLPIPFMRSSYFDTVESLIVPELYTYFVMKKHSLSYKDATEFMYGKYQSTVFHVLRLENEELYSPKPNQKINDSITVQSTDGDLFSQNTDGIVIKTDSKMKTIKLPNFRSREDFLGKMVPQFDFTKLKVKGDVGFIEMKSECRSKYIFYIVDCKADENVLREASSKLFRLADNLRCRSLTISAIEFNGITKKKVAETYLQSLKQETFSNLKLVRFNGERTKLGTVYRNFKKLVK
ncbi:uncharacterized protein [Clytia hemisphaerica]